MHAATDPAADRRPTSWSRGEREWTPGFSDWLGDRFLDFDLATATSLERLQFRREFGDSAAFEAALRERVDLLQHFQHPSIEATRAVVRVPGKGLILESKHTAGRRLSEAFPQDRGGLMALDLIRQLVPILVLLHKTGEGVAHGAIGAERIVVTRDGRLILVEHALGSALAAQMIPAARWRTACGLPADRDVIVPEPRTDLIQLGFLALSLLLGRRLNPSEYPDNIEPLVAENSMSATGRSPEAAWLRRWIERAVQVGPNPFESAQEAYETMNELSETGIVQTVAADKPTRVVSTHAMGITAAPPPAPSAPTVAAITSTPKPPAEDRPVAAKPKAPAKPVAVPAGSIATLSGAAHASAPRSARQRRWLTPGLVTLAAGEALVIAGLIATRTATISVDAVAQNPAVVSAAAPVHAVAPATHPPTAGAPETTATPAEANPQVAESRPAVDPSTGDKPVPPAAPPAERFGGVRVTSPLALQVFEGDKLLGTTLGPIALSEGPHALQFVNDALEFRVRVSPLVKAGQMTPIVVALPNGRLSINAIPWADVLIDGKPAGQTPLANLSVPIGDHEIVFRHPQFGEQKQTVTVKAETPARVSLAFPKTGER